MMAVMMSRTQIVLDPEIQRRARRRAHDMGISLAEYVRRLVAHDLGTSMPITDVTAVFDLGASAGSNIARNKDAMLADTFAYKRGRPKHG
jgi:hypothetical protein